MVWPEFINPCWPLSTSPYGWLRLVWKSGDLWDISQSYVHYFESSVSHFKVAYTLRHSILSEACWSGVCIFQRCIRLLVRFGFLGFGFELWACSKSFLGLTYSKLFLINKIVSSSESGILDFVWYKIGCLQIYIFYIKILNFIC